MVKNKTIGLGWDGAMAQKQDRLTDKNIKTLLEEFQAKNNEIKTSELLDLADEYPIFTGRKVDSGNNMEKLKIEVVGLIENIDENIDEIEHPSFARFLLESQFWKNILIKAEPVDGIEIFREICENEKHEVHIIPWRLSGDFTMMKEWLEKHSIPTENIHFHLRWSTSITKIEFSQEIIKRHNISVFYCDLKWIVEEIPQAQLFTEWNQIGKDLGP